MKELNICYVRGSAKMSVHDLFIGVRTSRPFFQGSSQHIPTATWLLWRHRHGQRFWLLWENKAKGQWWIWYLTVGSFCPLNLVVGVIINWVVSPLLSNLTQRWRLPTGEPLGDLPNLLANARIPLNQRCKGAPEHSVGKETNAIHSPASIAFVRNRMLYARAALNAQGEVRFGLRHIRMFPAPYSVLLLIV